VRHTSLTISSNTGPVYLDVYAPKQANPLLPGKRGAMLFIPGVGDNRTDPQLVNLDESLAENGVVVMNLTTTALINYDISPDDSDAVVRAFQRLSQWPGVDPKRIGIVGFSGGAPLGCLAAVDPRIRSQVAYVLDFGGYYNVVDVLRDFGRRAIVIDGKLEPWHPTSVPISVIANILSHVLPDPDASELQAAFDWQNATPLTPDERAALSPEGEAAYDLLSGDAPSRVNADIATLTAAGGDLLTALSPSSVVDQIRTPIYLLHDRGDTSLPVTEARDFAAALTRLHHPHDYVEVTIFDHTQVRSGLPIGEVLHDGSALARLLYELLSYAS
jgi:acetyl esterase/lipase